MDSTLLLNNNRFAVDVTWRKFDGTTGIGTPISLSSDSGYFWFFGPDNIELVIKVIDACGFPGAPRYWVYAGGLTNVETTITVRDTEVPGAVKTYFNALGTGFQPILDSNAFDTCSGGEPQTLLSDAFNDGQTTGWNLTGGVWTEANGYLRSTGTSPGAHRPAIWTGGSSWSNYTVETDVRIESDSCAKSTQAYVRYQSQSNSCQCQLNACGTDRKVVSCPSSSVNIPFSFSLTQYYRMRINANGKRHFLRDRGPGRDLSLDLQLRSPSPRDCGSRVDHGPGRFDNLIVTSVP